MERSNKRCYWSRVPDPKLPSRESALWQGMRTNHDPPSPVSKGGLDEVHGFDKPRDELRNVCFINWLSRSNTEGCA